MEPSINVLVVEDEWLIAEEVIQSVEAAGYRAIGPASTTRIARKLIDTERVDAALLDVSLRQEESYSIIEHLRSKDIPFAFLTGYNPSEIEPDYRDVTCLTKPVAPELIAETLDLLFRRSRLQKH